MEGSVVRALLYFLLSTLCLFVCYSVLKFGRLSLFCLLHTTNVVSSNPAHGEMYSIQHYVISELRQAWDFLRVLRFPSPIELTAKI